MAYTEQETLELVQKYQAGQTVEELALVLSKSVKSVVAKLSREGVYQKKVDPTQKPHRAKKDALVQELEALTQASLPNLLKVTQRELEVLLNSLKQAQ